MIYRQLVEELEAKKQQTRSAEIALYKRKLALSVAKKEYAREKAQVQMMNEDREELGELAAQFASVNESLLLPQDKETSDKIHKIL